MIKTDTPVARFFEQYAAETASDNFPAIASHFGDPFLAGGPSGTQSIRVADFAAALPKRKALFQQLESQPTRLIALTESPLDCRYVLARTTWRLFFGPQQLDVDSTFLVDTGDPQSQPADFRILLYLSHQDLLKIVRERGILANGPQS